MAKWCKKNVPDRTARRYIGVALSGHHPQGEEHIFSERWFQNGGIPNGFRMWVPIIKK